MAWIELGIFKVKQIFCDVKAAALGFPGLNVAKYVRTTSFPTDKFPYFLVFSPFLVIAKNTQLRFPATVFGDQVQTDVT